MLLDIVIAFAASLMGIYLYRWRITSRGYLIVTQEEYKRACHRETLAYVEDLVETMQRMEEASQMKMREYRKVQEQNSLLRSQIAKYELEKRNENLRSGPGEGSEAPD